MQRLASHDRFGHDASEGQPPETSNLTVTSLASLMPSFVCDVLVGTDPYDHVGQVLPRPQEVPFDFFGVALSGDHLACARRQSSTVTDRCGKLTGMDSALCDPDD